MEVVRDKVTQELYLTDNYVIDPDDPTLPIEEIVAVGDFSNVELSCAALSYDKSTGKLKMTSENCDTSVAKPLCFRPIPIPCNASDVHNFDDPYEDYDGSGSGDYEDYLSKEKEDSLIDILLNPELKSYMKTGLLKTKTDYRNTFRNLDLRRAYNGLYDILWHSQLPCFDTASSSSSMLKRCLWKGLPLSCAAIFKTFPTDRGMCCTFNMERAEEMFRDGEYQTMITTNQYHDKGQSKDNTEQPQSFKDGEEPVPQPGINKGLSLVLDAHTNLLAPGSVPEDFQGFIAMIGPRNQFPLSARKNIRIRAGYDNLIGLSGTVVHADGSVDGINPTDRNCFFSHESPLKFHKKYSQTNCLLECQMEYVKNLTIVSGSYCTPWYLPKIDDTGSAMCDPWDSLNFTTLMRNVPDKACNKCLPDCNATHYQSSVTALPFRSCDEKNLGVSFFCNFDSRDTPDPPIFGDQVRQEYETQEKFNGTVPNYITVKSNFRSVIPRGTSPIFTRNAGKTYDAYQKDFATVQIYFESPTVFQFFRRARMTWTDFLSQIGGLLGLCIGFSFCSLVEIIYWFTIRLSINMVGQASVGTYKKDERYSKN